MISKKRPRPTTSRSISVINPTSMYALGMLYGKGDIIFKKKKCQLKFGIIYRKPSTVALRTDNLGKTKTTTTKSITFSVFNEFVKLHKKLGTVGLTTMMPLIPEDFEGKWDAKEFFLMTEPVSANDPTLLKLFDTDHSINSSILEHVPNYLFDDDKTTKQDVIGFLQGVADSTALPPSTTTSSHGTGKEKNPRLQLELKWRNWYTSVEICRLFQRRLKIPVTGINWAHPSIRGVVSYKQNQQFRIYAQDWIAGNFNFQLKHKKEAFENLLKQTTSSKKTKSRTKYYPEGTRPAKRLPLKIPEMPFTDSRIPEELHNFHWGTFGINPKKIKTANKMKFKNTTDKYSTYQKEMPLFKSHKKGVLADGAAPSVSIYNILKQKSYPLGPNFDYND